MSRVYREFRHGAMQLFGCPVPPGGVEPPRPHGLPGLNRLRLPFRHGGPGQMWITFLSLVPPARRAGSGREGTPRDSSLPIRSARPCLMVSTGGVEPPSPLRQSGALPLSQADAPTNW